MSLNTIFYYQGFVKGCCRADVQQVKQLFCFRNLSKTDEVNISPMHLCSASARKTAVGSLRGGRRSPCLCTGHFRGRTRRGCTHIQKLWDDLPLGCYTLTGGVRIWQPLLWSRGLLQPRTAVSTRGWADSAAESGSGDTSRNMRNKATGETTNNSVVIIIMTYFESVEHSLVFKSLIKSFPEFIGG